MDKFIFHAEAKFKQVILWHNALVHTVLLKMFELNTSGSDTIQHPEKSKIVILQLQQYSSVQPIKKGSLQKTCTMKQVCY